MLNVTEEQIEAYNSNSVHKELKVYIGGAQIPSQNIVSESFKLKEMLLDGKNVEFVGCNSSELTIQIKNVYTSIKGQRIVVSIKTDDTDEIPLFKGYIYSAKNKSDFHDKEIKAYDILYTIGQYDVASWYEGLTFPITLANFRTSLFAYINQQLTNAEKPTLPVVSATLPNDSMTFDKQYEPNTLKCLSVLKAICQINGCFGIINREEKFEFRFLPKNASANPSNTFEFAKKITQEDFYVKPFDRVVIRENENDVGVNAGNSTQYLIANKYIIQANMFTYKMDSDSKTTVAQNIYDTISNISFTPVDTDNNGMPFVEVGDRVQYSTGNTRNIQTYTVLNRELSGIQALRDTYGADGDEEASEYITDLQTQIDTIKQSGGGGTPEDVYTKEETDERIEEVVREESMQVVSCSVLPNVSERSQYTIYLVQGDIFIGG